MELTKSLIRRRSKPLQPNSVPTPCGSGTTPPITREGIDEQIPPLRSAWRKANDLQPQNNRHVPPSHAYAGRDGHPSLRCSRAGLLSPSVSGVPYSHVVSSGSRKNAVPIRRLHPTRRLFRKRFPDPHRKFSKP